MPATPAPSPPLFPPTSPSTIIDILVKNGALSQDQAEKLKLAQITSGRPLEQIIQERNLVTEEALTRAKAEFYKVPYTNLAELASSPVALSKLPQAVAQRYQVLPFAYNPQENELSLAMADPLNLTAIEFIESKTSSRVRPFAVIPSQIPEAIISRYGQSLSSEVTEALKETTPEEEKVVDLAQLGQIIREAPIAKIVSTILEFAMKSRASDVHIEPEENRTRIRYRIDGILHEKLMLPRRVHDAVVSRIKILAGLKIDEKRKPQDGRFNFKAGDAEVDLRVSSLPTVHGEKVVMRLLKKTGGVPELTELGLRGRALKNLENSILVPHGIILITGPTGSGKTTTLYSILNRLNTPKVNILTLEDPVEYKIAGVNQVQVNPQAGLTFANGLRSFVRQDPNIIMVGEVRDHETADLAIQAALTGHLVFSTLHTNSAAGAIPRLLDMGAEPYLLASTITAIVAQRVVRRIHDKCKYEYEPPAEVLTDIKQVLGNLVSDQTSIKLAKGKGDAECNNTGYFGRVGIFEVLTVTERIGRLLLERATTTQIEAEAIAEGMIAMKQDGYLKALEQITTIEEVLRVAEEA